MGKQESQVLRKLPSVDVLLKAPELQSYLERVGREVVVSSIREAVDEIRNLLVAGKMPETHEDTIRQKIVAGAELRVKAITRPHYRRVINATGIILHTGLGRAVLPAAAIRQIRDELSGYSLLQVDIETGKRSKRDECIERLLQELTGAEAATVVNNNAAATAIVLNTVGKGKEVIVSRGQLVEIGGSFRLPEVMAFSGAKLVEVGTTNKTHPHDYVNAITENTAAILRVHPSNGAGALIDFSQFGFEPEPTLPESIRKGADIVTCSADKLIGASQAGIILGKAKLIEAIRKNQFARIVRAGKLTLAALEATLKLFLDESIALREVPTLQMLRRSLSEITNQAERIGSQLRQRISRAAVATAPGFSQMGSGSLPTQGLATMVVAVQPEKISVEQLANRLRHHSIPIFARIQNDQVLIDPRTLRDGDEEIVVKALLEILGSPE
jgi:L-seryl-tRNA(Ser) seleniumtransferase